MFEKPTLVDHLMNAGLKGWVGLLVENHKFPNRKPLNSKKKKSSARNRFQNIYKAHVNLHVGMYYLTAV